MSPNKHTLAQFYTPAHLSLRLAKLLQNTGSLLEPSCGDGSLLRGVKAAGKDYEHVVGVELDSDKINDCAGYADSLHNLDFFAYQPDQQFDSIIANPPFLANKAIPQQTKELPQFKKLETILGGYANLTVYFVLKCAKLLKEGGEMCFVVPDTFFTSTATAKLNTWLHNHGTVTHLVKFKKAAFLPEVSQPVLLFRWVKGNFSYETHLEVV